MMEPGDLAAGGGLVDLPTSTLLARFASAEPSPGGGSASALAGALAAALARMVAGLTVGKKGYEAAADEVGAIATQASGLQARLERAVSEDAASFDAVMAAMGLPKATDEEKAARQAAMQEALKGATLAPMEVAGGALEAGRLGLRLLAVGNKNASTDAAVAVLLARAGGEGALLNAAINLQSIKDAAWAAEHQARCDGLWQDLAGLGTQLWPDLAAAGLSIPHRP